MGQMREKTMWAAQSYSELLGRSRAGFYAGWVLMPPLLRAAEIADRLPRRENLGVRLQRERPLHEAKLGQRTAAYGEKTEDDVLVGMGRRAMVKAVLLGRDDPEVPAHIYSRTVDLVAKQDFDIASTPYMEPSELEAVAKIITHFQEQNMPSESADAVPQLRGI